jgi:hypothetical protein
MNDSAIAARRFMNVIPLAAFISRREFEKVALNEIVIGTERDAVAEL